MRRCLVVDPMHESLLPMLEEAGWAVSYQPDITRDEIRHIVGGFEGMIIRSKTWVDRDLLGDNPSLKFIGRAGAGLDNLDMPFIQSVGITVVHAAEGNRDAVGEYAVGALLALMRHIPRGDAEVRKKIWNREANRGEELSGKTVAVIGYGNMGKAFARKISGFGCKVLTYDKYKSGYSDQFCLESDMQTIFREADIVSLHVPLTTETRAMVSAEYLKNFQKPIRIINTARGEVLMLQALVDGLVSGHVRGAVLDVLENEKLQQMTPAQLNAFNFLVQRDDVIFTPHIAGWTVESHVKINVALVDKIKSIPV